MEAADGGGNTGVVSEQSVAEISGSEEAGGGDPET